MGQGIESARNAKGGDVGVMRVERVVGNVGKGKGKGQGRSCLEHTVRTVTTSYPLATTDEEGVMSPFLVGCMKERV